MGNYNSSTIHTSSINKITIPTTEKTSYNEILNVNPLQSASSSLLLENNENFPNNNEILINSLATLQNSSSSSLSFDAGLLIKNANANLTKFSNYLIDDDNSQNLNKNNYLNIGSHISTNYNNNGLLHKLNEKFSRGLSSNEVNMIRNHVTLNGGLNHHSNSNNNLNGGYYYQNQDDLLKQMEYDKFMNEIWIGIVLTLIVISLVFCICSCFLYHQFRQWKRNCKYTKK